MASKKKVWLPPEMFEFVREVEGVATCEYKCLLGCTQKKNRMALLSSYGYQILADIMQNVTLRYLSFLSSQLISLKLELLINRHLVISNRKTIAHGQTIVQ